MANHYDWLDQHFRLFLSLLGIEMDQKFCDSIVVCDGDKCYGYQHLWTEHGIPFEHGVALYLTTKLRPFCEEVRQTPQGWVAHYDWVINNYARFKKALLEAEQKKQREE